jgi:uncharacterized membrane protein
MNAFFSIFITAMLPISELRGAIPLALGFYHWPIWQAFLISIIGNLIPVVLILLFLDPIAQFLSRHFKICNKFFNWLFTRTRQKHSAKFERWGALALISFVAIPLPFTGAWTGALVAFLFGVKFKQALGLIILGVLIAGIIVTAVSVGAMQAF